MDRRGFMGRLAGCVAGVFVAKAVQKRDVPKDGGFPGHAVGECPAEIWEKEVLPPPGKVCRVGMKGPVIHCDVRVVNN